MSPRPLALVSGLTIGDYLLWNWSLNANHDVLSLISGLTLPPLVIAWLWLLTVSVARVVAQRTRRPPISAARGSRDATGVRRASSAIADANEATPAAAATVADPSAPTPSPASSRKLAA